MSPSLAPLTLDLSGLDPVITELSLHGTQPNEVVATDILASGVYVTSWNFTDNLGSLTTVASLDQSNWKVVHRTTAEYGGAPHHLGDTAIAHLTSQSIWAGHHYDPDTGLLEAKARWYDPESGRFISPDPSGFAAGDANLYRYVGNGPTNATDPSGLEQEKSGVLHSIDLALGRAVQWIFKRVDDSYHGRGGGAESIANQVDVISRGEELGERVGQFPGQFRRRSLIRKEYQLDKRIIVAAGEDGILRGDVDQILEQLRENTEKSNGSNLFVSFAEGEIKWVKPLCFVR